MGRNLTERRQARAAQARRRARRNWILGMGAAVGLVVVGVLAAGDAAAAHPAPRAMDHAGHVVPAEQYAAHSRVAQVYRQAAEVPHVLDGIYCYCACSEHSGHYSLLDCFASDHGARCDICLSEASLAHRMTADGRSLDDIREAVDGLYGG